MQNLFSLLERAVALHRAGRLAEAGPLYIQVLSADPRSFDARHLLGIVCLQTGQPLEALTQLREALAIRPQSPEAASNCALALQALGRPAEALVLIDQAVALAPKSPDSLSNRGNLLGDLGRLDEALASYDAALAADPRHADALSNRGNLFNRLDRPEQALGDYDAALKARPASPEILTNRGVVLRRLGRLRESLAAHDQALALRPDHPEALNNRGAVLQDLTRFDQAMACFDRALALRPAYPEALNNRGLLWQVMARDEEALRNFDAALAARPGYTDALVNRGYALTFLGRPQEALACFETALAQDPGHGFAFGGLAAAALAAADWPRRARVEAEIGARLRQGAIIPPLVVLDYCDDPELQELCAQSYMANAISIAPPPLWQGRAYGHDRIRLAYVSADFRDHPVGALIAPLIEGHDRARFEVIGVSLSGDDGSRLRARLEKAFDKFHVVEDHSSESIARLLHQAETDIAIDLMGLTKGARSEIFKFRPAPVQVNWLGYAGSMGADFIDYVIGDAVALPFALRGFFRENIVQLRRCCLPPGEKPGAAATPSRQAAGLPEQGLVFAAFHHVRKINPAMFDIWMRLLAALPGSVLWLRDDKEAVRAMLKREAQMRGIDPVRLIFAPRLAGRAEHLARHRLADLALDTLPYNAHAAAADCVQAGVPLVSCLGHGFAGRLAGSVMHAAGCPELATASLADYEALALALARDPGRRAALRARLDAPLFDGDDFRADLEQAFQMMQDRVTRGEPAQGFAVP